MWFDRENLENLNERFSSSLQPAKVALLLSVGSLPPSPLLPPAPTECGMPTPKTNAQSARDLFARARFSLLT